ncbi:MAG: pseudouridine synthase [Armatimonadota bacterium]|nr:pseudouridine synthase [Armatimonadota bacterium]
MEQRLQKLLAAAGVASRREAENLILAGRVAVNGKVITQLGAKADPDKDKITVDEKLVDLHPQKVYVLLNKPRGYTCTRRDPHAAKVITDLVKGVGVPLYPVGRLDVETEGLIILTNDGDFAYKITHPKFKVPKTYHAEVKGLITQDAIRQLRHGVRLDDGITQPALIKKVALNTARYTSSVDIVIYEGRKRQVRRMFDAIGYPVIKLTRTKIGGLEIRGLRPGEWRFLTPEEVGNLLAVAS